MTKKVAQKKFHESGKEVNGKLMTLNLHLQFKKFNFFMVQFEQVCWGSNGNDSENILVLPWIRGRVQESEADDGPCHRGGGKGNCWNVNLSISWLILWVNARMTM